MARSTKSPGEASAPVLHATRLTVPFVVGGVISLPVALVAWRRRSVPGAMPQTLFMSAVVEWSLGNALETWSVDLAGKVFWASIEYVGIVAVPVMWIAVALEFSGRGEWLTRRWQMATSRARLRWLGTRTARPGSISGL
ncbi:MAG: histidine kinase N-terminal 7TM domain-containing protein [Bacillota bacterium]